MIAYSELTNRAVVGEVKVNPKNISLEVLRRKAQEVARHLSPYEIEYRGYSLEDVLHEL